MRLTDEQRGSLERVLSTLQGLTSGAYNNAYLECCGRPGLECCGDAVSEWSDEDEVVMDELGPIINKITELLRGDHETN